MTLSYDDIFSRFLGCITDYDIVSVNPDDAYSQMREWLRKAYSKPYLNRIFSSSVLDDEIQTLTFEMSFKVNDDSDKEFVIEILSKGMVIEWLQPQVKSKLLTQQMFSGKEQKHFSQAQHISEMRGMLEDTIIEQRKIIRDRGYIYNSYLGGNT